MAIYLNIHGSRIIREAPSFTLFLAICFNKHLSIKKICKMHSSTPSFPPQVDNAWRAVEKGVGVIVPGGKEGLRAGNLKAMIEQVVYNAR